MMSTITRSRLYYLSRVYYSTTSSPSPNTSNTGGSNSSKIPEKIPTGAVYKKIPARIFLQAGKSYFWCSCGKSKKQPLCDGTHKIEQLPQKPVKFEVEKSKKYWLCNCKQTTNRPFCNGTHVIVMAKSLLGIKIH